MTALPRPEKYATNSRKKETYLEKGGSGLKSRIHVSCGYHFGAIFNILVLKRMQKAHFNKDGVAYESRETEETIWLCLEKLIWACLAYSAFFF